MRVCEVRTLGLVGYAEGLKFQEQAVADLSSGAGAEQLFLLEHNHVFTLGRAANPANILLSERALAGESIELHHTGRGGDVTYHGPGQLVGYPIINLRPDRCDVHRYVRDLEEVMIRTIVDFGITGTRIKGLTGVWVRDQKIGAIGVRIARWITSHGFALNVNTDLRYFGKIVPCGITTKGVTSLERLTGEPIPMADVCTAAVRHFAEVFDRGMVFAQAIGDWAQPEHPGLSLAGESNFRERV